MSLYEAIFDPQEGEPVQYLGVYALRWNPVWGHPQVAFREAADQDDALQAKDWQIEALVTALEATRHPLREAECYHDGKLGRMYGQTLRRVEKAIKEAGER